MEPVSLFEPIGTDGGDSLLVMDQVGDPKNTDEQWLSHIALAEGMQSLSERERCIIAKRFWQGKTQSEVAEAIGITPMAVSQYERGERVPNDEIKVRLARYFNKSVEEIFFAFM